MTSFFSRDYFCARALMAPREIKHLFTEKGEVLLAIVMYGAKTLADIQSIFNQSLTRQWTPLKVLLDELIKEGDILARARN